MDAAEVVVAVLTRRGESVAVAESLTGGLLAASLTAVPGASAVMTGGVVAYATELKAGLLGVPDALLVAEGAVSADCAAAMAEGVSLCCDSTWGVSTTGVAGPTEQEGKPVGTVFIGVHHRPSDATETIALMLFGNRAEIRQRAVTEAVFALGERLAAQGVEPEQQPLG